ncbi:VWA domain-containing protein [Alphaproteobacteria bacterium]|nr:VWA domain-containing protein [Alphaproteobacteria bacterium]
MKKLFQALKASIHKPAARWTTFAILAFGALGLSAPAQAQLADRKAGDAILIMDYSNSMWGQINGVPKVDIARDIIEENFGSWNRLTNLGLLSYGHRYKNDCADIQLISPPGELDTSIVERFLAQAQPKGRTPLTSAIEQAASYFIANGKPANVILLTDGIESCDRDPCATIGALQDAGLSMTAHVIGFGVTEEEGSQLSCIASITGGEYLTAANADALDFAFKEAIELVQLNDEISDLQGMIGQLKDTLGASQQDIINLAADNSRLAEQGNQLQSELSQLRSMKDDLQSLYKALQNRAADLEGRNSALQTRAADLEGQNNALQTRAADLEVRNSQLQVMKGELQAQNSDLLNQTSQLRQELSQQTGRLNATEAALDDTQATLRDTKSELAATLDSLLGTEKALFDTKQVLMDTEGDLLNTRGELRATRNDLMDTQRLLNETQDDRDRQVKLVGNLRDEIDGLRDDLSASSTANLDLTQMNADLLNENGSLRAAIDQMLNLLTSGNEALKSAFSIGNIVSIEVSEKARMSAMSVDEAETAPMASDSDTSSTDQ